MGASLLISVPPLVLFARKMSRVAALEASLAERLNASAALSAAGQPLVLALGSVTVARDSQEANAAIAVLLDRSVALAQSTVGTRSESRVRAAFYDFDEAGLRRRAYCVYAGSDAPRRNFIVGRTAHEDEVIRFANGENAILVRDLENEPPPHFVDSRGRNYKSFISVPVRAGNSSFGLLTVDADRPFALDEADRAYVVLIAGVLGAGLAHAEVVAHEKTKRTPDSHVSRSRQDSTSSKRSST